MSTTNTSRVLEEALEQLRDERSRLDDAISELESLLAKLSGSVRTRGRAGQGKRGRAPGKRKGWTAEARRAAALRMKRYWAQRRKSSTESK